MLSALLVDGTLTSRARRSTSEIERHSARWKRRGCDCGSDTVQPVGLLPAPRSPPRPPPPVPVRAAVLIICEVVNDKDVCIRMSRLSVDFHRRFVANVSHGF